MDKDKKKEEENVHTKFEDTRMLIYDPELTQY